MPAIYLRQPNLSTRLLDQRQDRGSRWHTRTWWWQSKQTLISSSCLPLRTPENDVVVGIQDLISLWGAPINPKTGPQSQPPPADDNPMPDAATSFDNPPLPNAPNGIYHRI